MGLSRKCDGMLAAVIPCSPTSGRMQYAPTVSGEKLTRNDTIHHRIPQRINGKNVGAYRIRPPHGRKCRAMGTFTELQWYARHHHSLFAHVRAYAIRPYTSSLILITTTLNYTLLVKSNSTIHPKLLSLYNMNNSS